MDDRWEEIRANLEGSLIRLASCLSSCSECSGGKYSPYLETGGVLLDVMEAMVEDPDDQKKRPEDIMDAAARANDLKICRKCYRSCSRDLERIEQIEDLSSMQYETEGCIEEMGIECQKCLESKDAETDGIGGIQERLDRRVGEIQEKIDNVSAKVRSLGTSEEVLKELDDIRRLLSAAIDRAVESSLTKDMLKSLRQHCSDAIKGIKNTRSMGRYGQSIPQFIPKRKIEPKWFTALSVGYLVIAVSYLTIEKKSWSWVRESVFAQLVAAISLVATAVTIIGGLRGFLRKKKVAQQSLAKWTHSSLEED